MRYILKIVSLVVLTVVFTGCEYFKAPDATLNVQQGEIAVAEHTPDAVITVILPSLGQVLDGSNVGPGLELGGMACLNQKRDEQYQDNNTQPDIPNQTVSSIVAA